MMSLELVKIADKIVEIDQQRIVVNSVSDLTAEMLKIDLKK